MEASAISYPPRGIAWRSAIIVFFISVIAMADRMAIAMLIGPIKNDFGIGDFQASLLVGAAFTSFYMLFLMPIGWAADRMSRRKVLGACLLLWSIATISCGWATGFMTLFVLRMLVGAGEAALAPCCHGIIGDSFPRESLSKPLALQGIGFQVGSAVGVAAAGAVLGAGAAGAFAGLPVIGEMVPWRAAFIFIGLPGILALLVLPLLHDPRDVGRQLTAASLHSVSLFGFIREKPGLVVLALLAGGVSSMALGCMTAWLPEYLQRIHDVPAMRAGATLGSLLLVAAFAGQGIYAIIVDWLAAKGVRDAAIRIGLLPIALSIPFCWIAFGMDAEASFMPWLTAMLLCVAPCNAIGNTIIQTIAPPQLRSRMAALSILTISLFGFTLGPAVVGWFSQYVVGEQNLGDAMRIVIAGAMATSLLLLLLLRPKFNRHLMS